MESKSSGDSKRAPSTAEPPTAQTSQVGPISEPHEVEYLDDGVQRDSKLQVQWDTWMSDVQRNPSVYKDVFVLMLSWHAHCDDMSVDDEVKRLAYVFEDIYHYKVTTVLIDCQHARTPQVQANFALAEFVMKNDHENSLLIVYYAGHGSPGRDPGDLRMSGRRKRTSSEHTVRTGEWNHITWNRCEDSIRSAQADSLLIFDCCHGSDLAIGRDPILTSRSFEYLAASTTSKTRSPGDGSFTTALIWALKDLAGNGDPPKSPSHSNAPKFTTTKLAARICEAPDFPNDQKPSLTSRDIDSYRRIVLAPLLLNHEEAHTVTTMNVQPTTIDIYEDGRDEKHNPECLNLTFQFRKTQAEKELKMLADHLISFMKMNDTTLYKVQWGGITSANSAPARSKFRSVVQKVMARIKPDNANLSNTLQYSLIDGDLSPIEGGPANFASMGTPRAIAEILPSYLMPAVKKKPSNVSVAISPAMAVGMNSKIARLGAWVWIIGIHLLVLKYIVAWLL